MLVKFINKHLFARHDIIEKLKLVLVTEITFRWIDFELLISRGVYQHAHEEGVSIF